MGTSSQYLPIQQKSNIFCQGSVQIKNYTGEIELKDIQGI